MKDIFNVKHVIKRCSALILALIIILVCCGFTGKYNPKAFNAENIMDTIEVLSSREFNGRMAGTEDGKRTEEYVAKQFKKIGLIPGGDNGTYFQKFNGVSGNPSGPYILEVIDGDRVVKTYNYCSDYKFLTSLSYSGEVIAEGVQVDTSVEEIKKSPGQIALLTELNVQSFPPNSKPLVDLYDAGYRGVIVARSSSGSRLKGQMGMIDQSAASKLPRLSVIPDVYVELLDYCSRGHKIHMKSAFEVKNFTANNVIGIIKASNDTDKCLIISAHMDHLAPDPDGVYYPGALDNASGTASIIEIARSLKSQGIKPDVNIVFIAFSGEEEMLFGSQYYVSNPVYPLKNTKVINLDMVGAKSDLPMSIAVAGSTRGGYSDSDIVDVFTGAAQNRQSEFQIIDEDASDHGPFAMMGVPAVTIIDFEKEIYHVPEDTIDNIGIENLKRDVGIVMEVIGHEVLFETVPGTSPGVWIYAIPAGVIIIISGLVIYNIGKRRVS